MAICFTGNAPSFTSHATCESPLQSFPERVCSPFMEYTLLNGYYTRPAVDEAAVAVYDAVRRFNGDSDPKGRDHQGEQCRQARKRHNQPQGWGAERRDKSSRRRRREQRAPQIDEFDF